MGTYMAKKEGAERSWLIVDVKDQIVGRAATIIANALRGKDAPTYTPNVDNGHFVVAINAAQMRFTGKKWEDKLYHNHSGYTGGLKSVPAGKVRESKPEKILMQAVKGMLPRNFLSKKLLKKLKIYPGAEHPHKAQNAKELKLNV